MLRSRVGLFVLIGGLVLSVGVSAFVADREAQRREARVEGELRYASAALSRGLESTQALLFALDGPLARRDSALTAGDLRRLEPSLRAVVRLERRGGRTRVTRVVPADLRPTVAMLSSPARQAIDATLRRALGGADPALSRPFDTGLGRAVVAAIAVGPRERSPGGAQDWHAAVLGLDALVADALEGIDADVAVRIRALRDAAPPATVATYSPAGPVRDAVFDDAPSRRIAVADRSWVVHAAATGGPPLLSVPLLLLGLAVTALVLTLLTTSRLAEGRARTLAATMTSGLRERTRQMETLTENAPDLIGRFDRDRRLVFANTAMLEVTGARLGETPLDPVADGRVPAAVAASVDRQLAQTIATGEGGDRELELPVDGELREFEVRFVPERDDDGSVAHVLAIARDITDRVRAEREMATRALRDPLTGLANRALVDDRLQQALARRTHGAIAAFVIDLDRFKLINDSFGHAVGDRVLKDVGGRLLPLLREEDTLGRLGGDEFVVVAEVGGRDDALLLADRIVDALRPPMIVDGRRLSAVASIGVAIAQSGEHERAADLMRSADAAMYQAKSRGGDGFALYDQSMRTHARERLVLENDIRAGLRGGEFVAHFQPLVRASDRQVIGYEALARWQRPDGELAAPGTFIDAAEQTGLIVELGATITRRVLQQAVAWDVHRRGLRLWVNLSVRQLARPDFLETLLALLDEERVPCSALGFELTETAIAHGPGHVGAALAELRRHGARVAIDDFGIGYSSLSRIKELPIDDIKIDRSFIAGVGHDPNDTALVEAVVRLARARGARTVAEGIETEDQAARLAELGCDTLQGYLFGAPRDPAEIDVPAGWAGAPAR